MFLLSPFSNSSARICFTINHLYFLFVLCIHPIPNGQDPPSPPGLPQKSGCPASNLSYVAGRLDRKENTFRWTLFEAPSNSLCPFAVDLACPSTLAGATKSALDLFCS
jgi:hypothetical protein